MVELSVIRDLARAWPWYEHLYNEVKPLPRGEEDAGPGT